MKWTDLNSKKSALDALRPFPLALTRNLDDWFKVELTFTSNAIEGNTLTRRETAIVIEKGLTVGGKTLKEHLEATNHARALDFIHDLIPKKPRQLSESDILRIHEIVLTGIDDINAGTYRDVPVRISGSQVVLPNFRKVPVLMRDFITWLASKKNLHPAALASDAHYQLVTIHPFIDGNGRTARLLMNLVLMMHGFPPAIIRPRDRLAYLTALETAQLGGSKESYDRLIYKSVDRSLDLYLKAVRGEATDDESDDIPANTITRPRLKIGQLAKAVGETVPTIRFWTKEGLLEVSDVTDSGYQLFDQRMINQCKKIQELKKKRLTLVEIKAALNE